MCDILIMLGGFLAPNLYLGQSIPKIDTIVLKNSLFLGEEL